MKDATPFFDRELSQLDHDINRLSSALGGQASNTPRSRGLRQELELARHTQQIVREIAAQAHDPAQALVTCHLRHMKALRDHAHSRNGNSYTTLRSDRWWQTLGEAQYLGELTRRFEAWLREHRQPPARPGPNGQGAGPAEGPR